MVKKRYTPEMVIRKRRETEILQGQGKTIAQVIKHIGIANQAFNVGARSMAICVLTSPGDCQSPRQRMPVSGVRPRFAWLRDTTGN